MIIVNLKLRGLGGGTKAWYLRHIVGKEGVEFLCLQESKTSSFSDSKCFSLWGDSNIGWVHCERVNGAGSMVTMWHKEVFSYDSHVVGKGFIAIVGQHLKAKCQCVVVNVYAACNLKDKVALWETLTTLKQSYVNLAWCVCGDFNAVRSEDERKGIRGSSSQKKEIDGFNCFIESNGLVDLPFVGKKYTWFKSNGTAKSRLDRILVSEEWLNQWPASKQYVQPRMVSDHCALVLKSCIKDWGPKPFRSLDVWLAEPGFKALVKEKWGSYLVHGNSMSILKDKLKLLKADIRVWNKEVFGCMEFNKKTIAAEIEDLDDNDVLKENGKMRRMELFSQLELVEKKLDSIYRKKARGNWIKHGDINSKFFHNAIRWRRLKNEVKGVEIGGLWCEEPEVVRREAKSLFEKRFIATQDYGVNLGSVDFKSLSPEVSKNMITSFSEDEVRDAVWQCGGSKSPGPDGFNFNFIKSCWDVIRSDVMAAVHFFHATGTFLKGCNASFIALVPKVRDPSSLDQFRPISLVGVIYKIITKILSRRMKKVMLMIIDDCRSAFISGRGLTDSVVMANEILEEIKLNRRSGLCFKVDFEKAYDSVRWSFLFDMLRRLGFHDKWILWVKGYMVSSSVSVLINGSPTEEFKPSRGLR